MWRGEYTWIIWELWRIALCLDPWKSIVGCTLDALGPVWCDSMISLPHMCSEKSEVILCPAVGELVCLQAERSSCGGPTDLSHSPCCASASAHTVCPAAGLSHWVGTGHSLHFLSMI